MAGLVLAGCAALAGTELARPDREVGGSPAAVDAALAGVRRSLDADGGRKIETPRTHAGFSAGMARIERPLDGTLAAWKFWPIPPAIVKVSPPPPPPVLARLGQPRIARGGAGVGRGTVQVFFSNQDSCWRSRALQVWRKAPGDVGWPRDPLVTVLVRAGGEPRLPPGVTALPDGYEIAITDQAPRTPWEYRVRAAAVFGRTASMATPAGVAVHDVLLPPDGPEREDMLSDELAGEGLFGMLAEGAEPNGLIGPGAFASRFSAAVTLVLPGDTQIAYEAPAAFGDRQFAGIRIRHHRPGAEGADAEGWIERLERFEPGEEVRLAGERILARDPATGRLVPGDRDVVPGVRLVRLAIRRDADGRREVRVAVVRENVGGREVELVARADGGGWWPENPPLTPRPGEPRPAMAARPDAAPANPPR